MMKQIVADGNRVIELEDNEWRLLSQNGKGSTRILIEVKDDDLTIQFSDQFISQHRLPETTILNNSIRQIILGWSQQDTSWHLGLLLNQTLTESRGNPWCGLATWHITDDNQPGDFQQEITRAAKQLGQLSGIPVNIILPKAPTNEPVTGQETQPEIQAIPLPQSSGEWTLKNEDDSKFVITRAKSWINGRYMRIAWYTFWVFAFLMVSIATLTIPLGLPNSGMILPYPDLLPFMGITVSVIVVGLIIKNIREITSTANRIVLEADAITGYLNEKKCWTIPVDDIQAVYVSQIVRFRRKKNLVEYGEISLLNNAKSFTRLLFQEEEHENEKTFKAVEGNNVVTLEQWHTPLQAIALQLSRELDVKCYYDERS